MLRGIISRFATGRSSTNSMNLSEAGPGIVVINGIVRLRVTFSTGRARPTPYMEWTLVLEKPLSADIVVIARLCPPSLSILDYYVVPEFWQEQGDEAIFAAAWEMVELAKEARHGRKPTLQRTVTTLKRINLTDS
jgi:hypothetical protein